jgi:hypothetical protein
MTIDIELATNLIQAQNRTLATSFPNLQAPALDAYPTALDTASLPLLLTIPSGGSWYMKGGGWKTDVRTFTVIGFSQPLGQNDLPANMAGCVQLLQAVRNLYIDPGVIPLQNPVGGVVYQITAHSSDANPHSDSGIVTDVAFGGRPFYGFRLSLNVTIRWNT